MTKRGSTAYRSPHWSILLVLYLAIALAPLVLAWLAGYPRRVWNDELSSAAVMVAFAMLLMEFATTGRISLITDRLHQTLTVRWHRATGLAIAVVVFLHPYFYTQQASFPPPDDPTRLVHIGLTATSLLTGIAAWLLLLVLIVMAVFRDSLPYRYETWRIGHALGAIVVVALVLTHALIAGRYSQIEAIRWFWIGLTALAALALGYTYVIVPLMMRTRPYCLASREEKGKGEWWLTFTPIASALPGFHGGQFVWLSFKSPFSILEHPFTVPAGQSDPRRITLSIHEHGDWTKQIAEIPIGAKAFFNGPYG